MLSKFCQNPYSFFSSRLSYNNLNEVIIIGKEPYEIELQIYRRYQEKIVQLRLSNMGLKGGSGSSRVCPVLGVVVVFWP